MSKGKGSKGQQAYAALLRLMATPGDLTEIWNDLLPSIAPGTHSALGRALMGYTTYDDRAAALVYGSMVEQTLESAISTHFPAREEALRIFSYDDDGALATFNSKIAMGHALGIYNDRLRNNLKWIKNIRNTFAHTRIKIDFSTPEVIAACDELTFKRLAEPPPAPIPHVMLTPRDQYAMNAALAAAYLAGTTDRPLRFRESNVYDIYFPPPPSPEKS